MIYDIESYLDRRAKDTVGEPSKESQSTLRSRFAGLEQKIGDLEARLNQEINALEVQAVDVLRNALKKHKEEVDVLRSQIARLETIENLLLLRQIAYLYQFKLSEFVGIPKAAYLGRMRMYHSQLSQIRIRKLK